MLFRLGLSCFLGNGLLGELGDLLGEGVEVLRGVLVGVGLSEFIHDGCSIMSSRVKVGHLEGIFIVSGLSLALLSVLPLGGLTPRLGRVVILSMLGLVYGPKTVSSTWVYSLSPKVLIQSSRLLKPSLT